MFMDQFVDQPGWWKLKGLQLKKLKANLKSIKEQRNFFFLILIKVHLEALGINLRII
jgi:hypothetical protein